MAQRFMNLRFAEYRDTDSYAAEYRLPENEVTISHYRHVGGWPMLMVMDRYPFTGTPGDWDTLEEELNGKLTEMMAREGWYEHETS